MHFGTWATVVRWCSRWLAGPDMAGRFRLLRPVRASGVVARPVSCQGMSMFDNYYERQLSRDDRCDADIGRVYDITFH